MTWDFSGRIKGVYQLHSQKRIQEKIYIEVMLQLIGKWNAYSIFSLASIFVYVGYKKKKKYVHITATSKDVAKSMFQVSFSLVIVCWNVYNLEVHTVFTKTLTST